MNAKSNTLPLFYQTLLRDIPISILLLFLSILTGSFATRFIPLKTEPPIAKTIDILDLERLLQKPHPNTLLIDARSEELYQLGHIPEALSLPLEKFDSVFPLLFPSLHNKHLILYCSSSTCPTAQNLAKKLLEKKEDITLYQEGFDEWKIAYKPIIQGKLPGKYTPKP